MSTKFFNANTHTWSFLTLLFPVDTACCSQNGPSQLDELFDCPED